MTPGQWLALGIVGMSLGCAYLAAWVVVLERRCADLLREVDALLRQIAGES